MKRSWYTEDEVPEALAGTARQHAPGETYYARLTVLDIGDLDYRCTISADGQTAHAELVAWNGSPVESSQPVVAK